MKSYRSFRQTHGMHFKINIQQAELGFKMRNHNMPWCSEYTWSETRKLDVCSKPSGEAGCKQWEPSFISWRRLQVQWILNQSLSFNRMLWCHSHSVLGFDCQSLTASSLLFDYRWKTRPLHTPALFDTLCLLCSSAYTFSKHSSCVNCSNLWIEQMQSWLLSELESMNYEHQ